MLQMLQVQHFFMSLKVRYATKTSASMTLKINQTELHTVCMSLTNWALHCVYTEGIVWAACKQTPPSVSTKDVFRHSIECRSDMFWKQPEPSTQ